MASYKLFGNMLKAELEPKPKQVKVSIIIDSTSYGVLLRHSKNYGVEETDRAVLETLHNTIDQQNIELFKIPNYLTLTIQLILTAS